MQKNLGYLLDIYESEWRGVNAIWILDKDGKRSIFYHRILITFYVYGSVEELREIWKFLANEWGDQIQLGKVEKIHPFDGTIKPFLSVSTTSHRLHKTIARAVQTFNPAIELYDVGHPLSLHYAAFYRLFAFAKVRFSYKENSKEIVFIQAEEDRWETNYELPPLKTLNIRSNLNPKIDYQQKPIQLFYHDQCLGVDLTQEEKAFGEITRVIEEYDPDIILTDFGDSMLLPFIIEKAYELQRPSFLSRDASKGVQSIKASTLVSYGRVIHRKQQSLLFGRIHIDRKNMSFYTGLAVETIYEIARISGISVQEVARSTPGRAVASMEVIEALRTGTCIPYRKQKPEMWRNATEFLKADRGGMIFQPTLGVHENVASADFESMFPSIMVAKNLSPETMGKEDAPQGVIPRALEPLLKRRLYYKHHCDSSSEKGIVYKARSDALKWLLVVSFGYTGFKNAPLTSANIFEKINEWGRECLLDAKEIFERHGFEVLHVFIDSVFVKHEQDFTRDMLSLILSEVEKKTGLPISLEGVYKWVVFIPSKANRRYAVPNAYFGVFQNGEIKTRGIQCRRHDKPLLVKQAQMQILQLLAQAKDVASMKEYYPEIFEYILQLVKKLKQGQIALEELVITQRLSRDLSQYRMPSHAAQAGQQLFDSGADVRAGSKVPFIYVKGKPRVLAWDLAEEMDGYEVDIAHYLYLLEDAIKTVLVPFGIEEDYIHSLMELQPMKQLDFLSNSDGLRRFRPPSSESYYFSD